MDRRVVHLIAMGISGSMQNIYTAYCIFLMLLQYSINALSFQIFTGYSSLWSHCLSQDLRPAQFGDLSAQTKALAC